MTKKLIKTRAVSAKDELSPKDTNKSAIKARIKAFNATDMNQFRPPVEAFFDWFDAQQQSGEMVNVVECMSKAYEVVDLIMAELGKHSVCRKGCGYCCQLPVDLTTVEAAYISNVLNVELPESPPEKSTIDRFSPCPFLHKTKFVCTIREARPLNCRVFLTIDDWRECVDPDNQHVIFTTDNSGAMRKFLNFFMHISKSCDYPIQKGDLRQYFR